MKRCLVLDLIPQTPAVFSKTSATSGAHETLFGPSGSALWGWAAGKLYDQLNDSQRALIFHSGLVRFSDALPLTDVGPALPSPANLFAAKGTATVDAAGNLIGENVHIGRTAFLSRFPDAQPQQLRSQPVVFGTTRGVAIPLNHRLRTAMTDGTAATGQLFGYQAIRPRRLAYAATIEAETPKLTDGDWNFIREIFDGACLSLGRGRKAYGGSYYCAATEGASLWPESGTEGSGQISFLALSDVALMNAAGGPVFAPSGADIGIGAGWALRPDESVVSARRYAPWNSYLQCRDSEVTAIERGSVLRYDWRGTGPAPALSGRIIAGTLQERGLGRLVAVADFSLQVGPAQPLRHIEPPAAPDADLIRWARRMAEQSDTGTRQNWLAKAQTELDEIWPQMELAELPSRSQWQALGTAIDAGRALELPANRSVWNSNAVVGGERVSLRQWTMKRLGDVQIDKFARLQLLKTITQRRGKE